MDNKELMDMEYLEKEFSTGKLIDGGSLDPERQKKFMVFVREYGGFLPSANFIVMNRLQKQVDQLFIPEPVSESAEENTTTANWSSGVVDSKLLEAKKVKSKFYITTEFFQDNIEQGKAEETLMKAMASRSAMDAEILAISGDSSITATDPLSRLLKRLDGWDKQTDAAHIYDANGSGISKDLFVAMKKRMPKHYRKSRNLHWIMSDTVFDDWVSLVSERGTVGGDLVLSEGKAPKILGVPVLLVPAIPDDKALSLTSGLPAEIYANRSGPFQFSSTNNVLIIEVDNSGNDRTVTFPQDQVIDPSTVAKLINDILVASSEPAIAFSDALGRIVIRSTNLGAAAQLEIQVGSTAAPTLGIDGGLPLTFNGVDAATAGNIAEGSFIWYADPKLFLFGMLNKTRIYKKYNEDLDRLEITMYNQYDAKISDLDGIVKAKNIRVLSF